jgi:phage repressor protein C with HTH and peptisase S24 domain
VGRELWDEPVQSWVAVPPEIPAGKHIALKIVGESMAPLMHTGDTVLVRIGTDVKRDTIIVARHPEDGYVCKRVNRVRRGEIELSSIELGRPIITIPRDPSLVVGTVVLVWCHHRT